MQGGADTDARRSSTLTGGRSYNRLVSRRTADPTSRAVTDGRPSLLGALAAGCLAAIVAGCGLFSSTPSPSPAATSSAFASGSQIADTPAPTSRPVRSIALVAAVGESEAGTSSAMAWLGVQQVAAKLGASSSMTVPGSGAELSTDVRAAAAAGADVVVTVGEQAAPATRSAAIANASTQFFALDQTVAEGSPANLHGLGFDESEMGYLAGLIAASMSQTGSVGFVGDSDSDVGTANYAAGFRNGALFANAAGGVVVVNAGSATAPEKGRAAAASLVAGGADVIAALTDLSGIGAMREGCARKALVIALDADAWPLLPEVRPCLVTSIRKLYGVAIALAIFRYAGGEPVAGMIVSDVAGGGIALGDFHVTTPTALDDRLARVLRQMQIGSLRSAAGPASNAASPATATLPATATTAAT